MGVIKNKVISSASKLGITSLPTLGAAAGTVMDVVGTIGTFSESRKQGDSAAVTVGKTAMDFATGALLGWKAQLLYFGATAGYDLLVGTSKQNAELQKQMKYTGSGRVGSGYFNMSGAGYTMRQRAINQLRSNGQNVNSVLGNEARNYLKSSRDYT